MLVTKQKVNVNDIVAMKLISGEEIIAKIIAMDGGEYTLAKPFVQTLHAMPNGQGAVGFAPFMLSLDPHATVTVNTNKLLIEPIKARQDAAAQYIKATSGLDVPPANIVLPR
jgi:hypothetical protein